MARVDVIMPVRNGERFLDDTLRSLRSQSFRDWRLLALDHASSDRTTGMLEDARRADPRIEIVPVSADKSLADVLNIGLDLADGEYAFRQDADDVSHPRRFETLVAGLDNEPDLAFLGSCAELIDADGVSCGVMDLPLDRDALRARSLFGGLACHPTVGFRLSVLRELGARYGRNFIAENDRDADVYIPSLAEDYFMFGQLALLGRGRNLPQRLMKYRIHGSNLSMTKVSETVRAASQVSCCLARTFSAIHRTGPISPLPFVNHAEMLLDLAGHLDFRLEFRTLAQRLQEAFGPSPGLDRELSFRSCLQDRRRPIMAARFALHLARFPHSVAEINTVKTWLLRGVKRYPIQQIADPWAELRA